MTTELTNPIAFETKIESEYRRRRDSLQPHFPAAHAFLGELEQLCEANPRFHLGTTKNLHLYLDDRFIAYITMDRLKSTAPRLFLSAVPNVGVKEGTRLDSASLVPKPIDVTVMKHGGYKAGWAFRRAKSFQQQIEIVPGAPDAFFADVLKLVKALA